jgi:inner membrane protein
MSSAATHHVAGLTTGLIGAVLNQCPEEERLVLGGLITVSAIAGAKLPDILEPAIHAHHRAFFHSFVVLFGAAWAAKKLWDWRPQTAEQRQLRAVLLGLLIGYGSHLGLDSLTPRCLPIVC